MKLARHVGAVALGLVGCVVLAGSCAKNEQVELVLVDGCLSDTPPPNTCGPAGTDPCDCDRPPCAGGSFRDSAAYAEVAVFNGGCPPDDQLIVGDTSQATFHAVVPASDPLPEVGDLSKDKYGFAALLRDSDCGVIAMGCTTADLGSIRRVNVSVRAWRTDAHPHANVCAPYTPDQGCEAPLVCDEGRCVGEGGTSEGGTGGCSLSVVASGPLPATSNAAALVTGPAVAATDKGFVIVYREQDPTTGAIQIVGVPLPDSGTLGTASTTSIPGCVAEEPADGIGLAFSGTTGLAVASLQKCAGTGAGAAFIPVATSGALSKANQLRNPVFTALTLAPGHSVSARPDVAPDGGSPRPGFDFVFRAIQAGQTQTQIGILADNAFFNSPSSLFTDAADYGMVATTSKLQAILGRVPTRGADIFQVTGNGVTPPPPVDAGSDGSSEAGAEGGTSQNGEFVLPDSPTWGAVSALDSRAAAIVPGGGAGLTLQVADATGKDVGNGKITGGVFQSGDVVFLHDHLVIVGGSTHTLDFYRVDGATTSTSVSTASAVKTEFKDTLGKASLADFDGSRLAIAAARDHVAVVWLSTLALSQGVQTGGWALLSCSK